MSRCACPGEQGRPSRTMPRWLPAVATALLLILPVAVLLASCGVPGKRTGMPARSAATTQPGLPLKVGMTGGGRGWAVLVSPSAAGGSRPLHVGRTADSGTSWQTVLTLDSGSVPYLRGLGDQEAVLIWYPASTGKGVAGLGAGRIYSTTDAGRSWQSSALPGSPWSVSVWTQPASFVSATAGWLLASDGGLPQSQSLLHTSDGGRSWQRVAGVPGALTVSFVDSSTGWLGGPVAIPGAAPDLRVTHDGGHTWQPVPLTSPPASSGYPGITAVLSTVQAAGGSTLAALLTVAVGSQGVGAPEALDVYVSSDAGATWSAPTLAWEGKTALTGLPAIGVATGSDWTVAAGNQAAFTTDGGRTWTTSQLPLPAGYQAADVQFTGRGEGYLLGLPQGACGACTGILLVTVDGGRTWRSAQSIRESASASGRES